MPGVDFPARQQGLPFGVAAMDRPTDARALEEVLALLKRARLLTTALSRNSDDLDSLLVVTESEARRLCASAESKRETSPVSVRQAG